MTPSVIWPQTPRMPLFMPPMRDMPFFALGAQLELANMYRTGDLLRLVAVAKQTDLTFNLVNPPRHINNSSYAPCSLPRAVWATEVAAMHLRCCLAWRLAQHQPTPHRPTSPAPQTTP
jgi:hypothetical protein